MFSQFCYIEHLGHCDIKGDIYCGTIETEREYRYHYIAYKDGQYAYLLSIPMIIRK